MAFRNDILVDGIPLVLHRGGRGRSIRETSVPALAQETFTLADERVELDTFHLGAFYSQRLLPGTYAYAENGDGRHPRWFGPGPRMNSVTLTSGTTPRCAADFNGSVWIGAGRYVFKIDPAAASTTPVAAQRDLGAGMRAWSMKVFRNRLHVGMDNGSGTAPGTPQDIQSMATSEAWTTHTGIAGASLETVWWDLDYRLAANDTTTTIKHCAGDTTVSGNWDGPITIGDASSAYRINRLVASQDHLYVAKYDGLHDLDGHSGRSPNLTQALGHVIDTENGVAAHAAGGAVYMGHRKGLLRVRATGLEYGDTFLVQPGFGLPNETPVRGIVTAIVQDGGWIVAAVYNGTDTYICYGRDMNPGETSAGPSPMLWHGGLIKLASQTCYLLHVSNLVTVSGTPVPTLWVGAGNTVQWCYLARSDNPLQDNSYYEYATSYSLYIPGLDWSRPATPKNLLQIDVEGDNLSPTVTLAVNYNVEGGGYAAFGTARVSPQSEVLPTDEIVGRRIGFRFDGTGTATGGPNIRAIALRAAARVKTRPIRVYQIKLCEWEGDNYRGFTHRDPETVWYQLQSLEAGRQVQVRDEFGSTLTCLVHAPAERQEVEETVNGKSRTVQVVTLTLSVLRRAGTGWRWGDGSRWGTGRSWGSA